MKARIALYLCLTGIAVSCAKRNDPSQNVMPPPTDTVVNNPPSEKKWIVSTIAGNGVSSFVDGPALTASFHFPEDVVVAPDESIYVTDVLNFCVRKISAGQVSTFAGGSGFDIVNGTGNSAQFKNPFSITVDKNGNVFTTDDNDPRIRMISSGGQVSTYAGTGMGGFADGDKSVAAFQPGGYITADAKDNLYVADGLNNSIRRIGSSGQVTTISTSYHFSLPGGLAVDKSNNLYVANRSGYNILKISTNEEVSILAGTGIPGTKDGNAQEAQFSGDMRDLIIDGDGNLYLSDDNRIRKISPQGFVTTIAGSDAGFIDGEGSVSKFHYPNGLAIDTHKNLYVADLQNNRIRKISFQ